MDKTADARKQMNELDETKISINDFIIKACASALRQHPAVNSSWLGDNIRINKDINIGVAVAVDEGLLVPVLFAADRMGLREINSKEEG
jgi:pyruvate dehydrogenase E2 component (dihydrolipoamide acetyltransferase)